MTTSRAPESIPQRWLTVPECADILRVSKDVVYAAAKRNTGYLDDEGRIRVYRIGSQYRIPSSDLAAIEPNREEGPEPTPISA